MGDPAFDPGYLAFLAAVNNAGQGNPSLATGDVATGAITPQGTVFERLDPIAANPMGFNPAEFTPTSAFGAPVLDIGGGGTSFPLIDPNAAPPLQAESNVFDLLTPSGQVTPISPTPLELWNLQQTEKSWMNQGEPNPIALGATEAFISAVGSGIGAGFTVPEIVASSLAAGAGSAAGGGIGSAAGGAQGQQIGSAAGGAAGGFGGGSLAAPSALTPAQSVAAGTSDIGGAGGIGAGGSSFSQAGGVAAGTSDIGAAGGIGGGGTTGLRGVQSGLGSSGGKAAGGSAGSALGTDTSNPQTGDTTSTPGPAALGTGADTGNLQRIVGGINTLRTGAQTGQSISDLVSGQQTPAQTQIPEQTQPATLGAPVPIPQIAAAAPPTAIPTGQFQGVVQSFTDQQMNDIRARFANAGIANSPMEQAALTQASVTANQRATDIERAMSSAGVTDPSVFTALLNSNLQPGQFQQALSQLRARSAV